MKMDNGQLLPELRFPEFKGDWEESKIEEHFEFKNGLNKSGDFFGHGLPIINFMDVYKLNSIKKNDINGLVELTPSEIERYEVKKGDVFFTRTSETIIDIGMSATLVEDIENCVFSGFVLRARPKNKLLDPYFTSYCFQISHVRKEITTKSSMTTRALTSGTNLNKVIFRFPKEKKEQQKIANFLTAIDQRITLLKEKKAALEHYKKGLMQKIFSQEVRFKPDSNAPLLRGDTGVCSDAPETSIKTNNHDNPNEHPPTPPSRGEDVWVNYPDWEEKKLGSIGTFLGGGTPSTSIHKYWHGEMPWVSSSDVEENNVDGLRISRYISKEAINYSATKIVPENSLLIVSRVGIGKLAVTKQSICTSQDFSNFTPKNDDVYFLGYLLLFNKNKLFSVAQGTSIKGFTNNDLKSLKLKIPCIEEQQKIAGFLLAIDQIINALDKQITDSELFKKGLLQRMFV